MAITNAAEYDGQRKTGLLAGAGPQIWGDAGVGGPTPRHRGLWPVGTGANTGAGRPTLGTLWGADGSRREWFYAN